MNDVPRIEVVPFGDKLDLDAAAGEIERRRSVWEGDGFVVGPLTWRDQAPGWPYPLVARDQAREPDSVGVRCVRGPVEFAVVLFDGEWSPDPGGWADVEWFDAESRAGEMTAPNVADIESFAVLLDDIFERARAARP